MGWQLNIFWQLLGDAWSLFLKLMGTTGYGYSVVPLAGALIGWLRNKERRSLQVVLTIVSDALGASALVLSIIYPYEFYVAYKMFSHPSMNATTGRFDPAQSLIAKQINKQRKANSFRQPLTLKDRTELLASQIIDFSYDREGPIGSWKTDSAAQGAISQFDHDPNGIPDFRARLALRDEETNTRFMEFYWPQVVSLENDLSAAGADLSPISSAVALDSPRKIGLMLSVVANRIGKSPPFSRILTPVEAKAITKGFGGIEVEVYAIQNDDNSMTIANTLRSQFEKDGSHVNSVVFPLAPRQPPLHGLHLVFPSPDLVVSYDGMISAIEMCDMETTVEVRPMRQPPTILKIEVWPDSGDTMKRPWPSLVIRNRPFQ